MCRCFLMEGNPIFERLVIRRGMHANFRSAFEGNADMLTCQKAFQSIK